MEPEWPVAIDGISPRRLIGQGGFGQVWLAEQTNLDRPVAVKVGHRPFTADDDRRRFERECKALGRLTGHRHIIDVYTSGLSGGLPYLVLENVDGGTLAEHGPSLDEARLRQITDELCQAVGAAHDIGVLHRDLKPENVFLDRDGSAVLGDFGIARLGDGNNTEAGGITASMAFASPEILAGSPPSPAADLHSIVVNVLHVEPPPLAPYGISPGFEALLRRAMSKNPSDRPATVAQLRAELLALQDTALPAPNAPATQAAYLPKPPIDAPVHGATNPGVSTPGAATSVAGFSAPTAARLRPPRPRCRLRYRYRAARSPTRRISPSISTGSTSCWARPTGLNSATANNPTSPG